MEGYIKRLRTDLENSDMETGRDAMVAHALHLDLMRIVDTWKCMGETTFGVLGGPSQGDRRRAGVNFNCLSKKFRISRCFCFVSRSEMASILRTSPTSVIRTGLGSQTFIQGLQLRASLLRFRAAIQPRMQPSALLDSQPSCDRSEILLQAVSRGSEVERLFAEMMVNDYCALWELLFISGYKTSTVRPISVFLQPLE